MREKAKYTKLKAMSIASALTLTAPLAYIAAYLLSSESPVNNK